MKRPDFNIANVIFLIALVVATTLVTMILRNPATHHNLEEPEFYERTELAYFNTEYVYPGYGFGPGEVPPGTDPHLVGRTLYVRSGCVGCHGIFGEGSIVGPNLWDIDQDEHPDFIRDMRDGPGEMPPFPETLLTEDDLDLILLYLEAAPADARALGVTTTTTTVPPPPPTTTTIPEGDVTGTTEEGATSTTVQAPSDLTLEAPRVEAMTVDGDPSDWDGVPGIDMTLTPIAGEEAPPREASVKVAHDGSYIYVLFTVDDDFNWSEIDPHFAGSPAVMWAIENAAGPHMGGDDPTGLPGLGMVDIWYWRLECPMGVDQGGSVSGPGDGDPGNDDACNFDDEWATDPENTGDDNAPASENSLLGVFSHTNPVEDEAGTWFFEMRRPLQTGDPLDAQFSPGQSALLALAYWDPDAGQNGWGRRDHVQSSNHGWIDVSLSE